MAENVVLLSELPVMTSALAAADFFPFVDISPSPDVTKKINADDLADGVGNNITSATAAINLMTTGSAQIALIKSGTYSGNGATSQPITGVGFAPVYVKTWRSSSSDGTNSPTFERINTFGTTKSFEHIDAGGHETNDNGIISLDGDGFTVDDDGANLDPNFDGRAYSYLAFGVLT